MKNSLNTGKLISIYATGETDKSLLQLKAHIIQILVLI